MKAQTIYSFIESIDELFGNMFAADVTRGEPSYSSSVLDGDEVIALIGISGDIQGSIALAMPIDTALRLTSALLGMPNESFDATTSDAVAELVNIVGGGAKAKLITLNQQPLHLGLPSVLHGRNITVTGPSQAVWMRIPFESELGSFNLCMSLQDTLN